MIDTKSDRTRRHLANDRQPVCIGRLDTIKECPKLASPLVLVFVRKGERQRHSGSTHHSSEHLEFIVQIVEIGKQLQHAVARLTHLLGDPNAFSGCGSKCRGMFALTRPMHGCSICAKANRAEFNSHSCEVAHLGDLIV